MNDNSITWAGSKPMATRILTAAALTLGLLLGATSAVRAQPVCMSHDDLRVQLQKQFAEAPVANAIANNGALVELYATRDRSGWTLTMTRPGEMSCVLVAGESWNHFPELWREQMVEVPDRQSTP
jgi:opacity protein-like surface antigen